MSMVVCFSIFLCCSLCMLATGATIHKKSKDVARSLDCMAPVDGARLAFQNELDGNMENQQVAVGQRVELRCRVVGAPQATIRWKHNGKFLEKDIVGDPQARIDNGEMPVIGLGTTVSALVIDCAESENAGTYTCVAENECLEAIETSAVVSVKQNDTKKKMKCPVRSPFAGVVPKIVFWTDSRLERPEATVTLFCRATGNPLPSIEWFEKSDNDEYHQVSNDDKHLHLANGDMVIRGIKAAKSKASIGYKCVATNEYGSDSLESIVVIRALL